MGVFSDVDTLLNRHKLSSKEFVDGLSPLGWGDPDSATWRNHGQDLGSQSTGGAGHIRHRLRLAESDIHVHVYYEQFTGI